MSEASAHGNHAERIAHRVKRVSAAHERLRLQHKEAAELAATERAALQAAQPTTTEDAGQ